MNDSWKEQKGRPNPEDIPHVPLWQQSTHRHNRLWLHLAFVASDIQDAIAPWPSLNSRMVHPTITYSLWNS